VIGSGRPVLVIPYAGTVDGIGRRALIAWDGTREAVRAVHGALPLLDRAEAVMLVYVGVQQVDVEQYRPSNPERSAEAEDRILPSGISV
jgi:hypothetical protein